MLTKYLWVFFVSMVPLVELRGSIIISQGLQLPVLSSYIVAIIGNMLPVPVIYLFARKVLVWGADKPVIGKFFSWCLEKGEKGGKKLQEKAGRGLLDMDFKSTIIAVMLGVLLAGIIMMVLSVAGFGMFLK